MKKYIPTILLCQVIASCGFAAFAFLQAPAWQALAAASSDAMVHELPLAVPLDEAYSILFKKLSRMSFILQMSSYLLCAGFLINAGLLFYYMWTQHRQTPSGGQVKPP